MLWHPAPDEKMGHDTQELSSSTSITIFVGNIFYGKGQNWHLWYSVLSGKVNFMFKENHYFTSEIFWIEWFHYISYGSSQMEESKSISASVSPHCFKFYWSSNSESQRPITSPVHAHAGLPSKQLGELLREDQELGDSNSGGKAQEGAGGQRHLFADRAEGSPQFCGEWGVGIWHKWTRCLRARDSYVISGSRDSLSWHKYGLKEGVLWRQDSPILAGRRKRTNVEGPGEWRLSPS